MHDRRRLACVNIEDARIELREDLTGLRLIESFVEFVIRVSDLSNGLQDGCVVYA